MKKKLTAIITACAMMVTMVPSAVFATEATATNAAAVADSSASEDLIDIDIRGFNNSAGDTVFVFIDGDVKNTRYTCILDGVSEPLASGVFTTDGEQQINIPKSKIPNIDDPYAGNILTVTITTLAGDQVLKTVRVKQKYVSTVPTTVSATLRDGDGTSDRLLDVAFDSGYYPSAEDTIVIEGVNDKGNSVGAATIYYGDSKYTKSFVISNSRLADELNEEGLRPLSRALKVSVPQSATALRVKFFNGSQEMTKFTKIISLASKYGTLDKLELVFDNSEIYRGDKVTGTLYYINTNGKRYDISDEATVNYIDGGRVIDESNPNKPEFTVKNDATIGSTVSIIARYGSYSASTAIALTVGEKLTNNKVKLSTKSVKPGTKTNVTFTLLNNSGNTTTLDFSPTKLNYRFLDASDKDAKFIFNAASLSTLATNGTMSGYVECDKACTGKIELTFSDDNGHKYRVLSDTFTFTNQPDPEERTVTLTFGSNVININGQSKTMDVGPIAYQNRTFVPLRHVIEAFNAECNWDNKTNKITIKYDDKTIVMTPGSTNYTINGKAQPAMDVTPYVIASLNRTMVPLRFVGEAMGFSVEALPYADGHGVEKVVIKNTK